MNAPAPPVSGPRGATALRHAFGGVLRLALARWAAPAHALALAGIVALLGLLCGAFLHAKSGPHFYLGWIVGFYFTFLVPLMAFLSAGGAVREDFRPESVDYLATRPVGRPAYLVCRYLAHLLCAEADFLCAFAVLAVAGLAGGAADLGRALPDLLLAQALAVAAFAALGFLGGVITSRYVIVGLVYGAVIEVGLGQIPTELDRLSLTHQLRLFLDPFLASPALGPPAQGAVVTAALLAGYAAVMLAVAAAIFSRRELAGAAAREG